MTVQPSTQVGVEEHRSPEEATQKQQARKSAGFLEADYECAICSEILLDPVVGACGHDFCRSCLGQWRKVSEEQQHGMLIPSQRRPAVMCPICRAELSHNLGVCQRLKGVVESCFPEQLAKRRAEAQAIASEVDKRSQQLLALQACLLPPLIDPATTTAPQRPDLQMPDHVRSSPAFPVMPFHSGSTASTAEASLISSLDQDHASQLIADLAASPCLSSRSSQTLPLNGLMPALPGSSHSAWLTSGSLVTSVPDSHHHHHYHHYHHHHLPCLEQQQSVSQPLGPTASPDSDNRRGQSRMQFQTRTPQRPTSNTSATPRTPSGHRMSASGTSLPPLAPRRQLTSLLLRASTSGTGEPGTPRNPIHSGLNVPASAVQLPAGAGNGFTHDWGSMAAMDCFMDSDALGSFSTVMGRRATTLPILSPRLSEGGEEDEVGGQGVEHSELTFGALAGPTLQAQLLQMGTMLQQRGSDDGSAERRKSDSRLQSRAALTDCVSNDEEEGGDSVPDNTVSAQRAVPSTPRASDGQSDASFEFFAQANGCQPARPAWLSAQRPAHPAVRASLDGSFGFEKLLAQGQQQQQQQQFLLQRSVHRRPSEPGCGSRPAPARAATSTHLGGVETKFTAALKRMREEDDAAEAAGRPRTSAMRRLFVGDNNAAARSARPAATQVRFAAPAMPAWPPSSARRAESSLVAAPVHAGACLPGCTSISGPVDVNGLSLNQRAGFAAAAPREQAQSPVTRMESWMPPPTMRLHAQPNCRRATYDGSLGHHHTDDDRHAVSHEALNFFDSLASTPRVDTTAGLDEFGVLAPPQDVFGLPPGADSESTPRYRHSAPIANADIMRSEVCTPVRSRATSSGNLSIPMDGVIDCSTPTVPDTPVADASPCPPLPSLARSQSAITSPVPSILQLATPLRIVRRSVTAIDMYSRTCPSTPRARNVEPASPFNQHTSSSALIAALMLPPPPPADMVVRAQRAAASTALEQSCMAAEPAAPAVPATSQSPALMRSLQQLVARRPVGTIRSPQSWHNREVDKPLRGACSSALAAMFADRFSEQLGSHPHGAVFLYVKAIEEHMYYTTPSLQQYADLSTLQARMVQAVDELIAADRAASSST